MEDKVNIKYIIFFIYIYKGSCVLSLVYFEHQNIENDGECSFFDLKTFKRFSTVS